MSQTEQLPEQGRRPRRLGAETKKISLNLQDSLKEQAESENFRIRPLQETQEEKQELTGSAPLPRTEP